MPTPATPTGSPTKVKGTTTHATATSLTDHIKHWTKNQWENDTVESTSNGHKTRAKVVSNNATTLTVDEWSDGVPDPGAEYTIEGNAIAPDISADDIGLAIVLFYDEVPDHFNGILTNGNGWSWDATSQRFIGPSGSPLSDSDLKSLAILFALAVEHDMREMAQKVANGTITIEEFQAWMAQETKNLYVALAALGAGGADQLTAEQLEAVRGEASKAPGLAFSLARLQLFAAAIASGDDGTVESIINRAAAYADSSTSIFEGAKRISHTNVVDDKGRPLYAFERNILGEADHCSPGPDTEGCPELTDAGWVPIGTMPLPGLRTCRQNCKCRMQYSLLGNAGNP